MSSNSDLPPTLTSSGDPPPSIRQTPNVAQKTVIDNPHPYLTPGRSPEEPILLQVGQGAPTSEMLTPDFVKNNRDRLRAILQGQEREEQFGPVRSQLNFDVTPSSVIQAGSSTMMMSGTFGHTTLAINNATP
jgi:hypothetical protein